MAYKLMIQGTMSSAGKSFIVTGLCRLFSDLGYKVAPFKSQNMALNSGVTFDGYEMGRAQIVQAEAARTIPDVRMNPVLLKPNSDVGSQVIVMGKPIGNMYAKEYYDYKKNLVSVIKDAFYSLEKEYDIIIVEGAGSPAEINLKENDIVNMGLAKMLDISVLLVGDIDLGGVFAQLLGTLEWLDEDEKNRIKGLIINKFRGDVSLLTPGIKMLEDRTKKKVISVVPYCKANIDEEDSVTVDISKAEPKNNTENNSIKIDVIRLPHMSNFTDFTPLKRVPFVSLNYIKNIPESKPDLLIIPGTKNTISDLNWLKESGLSDFVLSCKNEIPIMGICGGNQILGKKILDPDEIEGGKEADGLSLINQITTLKKEKILTKTSGNIKCEKGFFSCLNGAYYEGYEIHSGVTKKEEDDSSIDVFGTYIHGIFDKATVTKALLYELLEKKKNIINDDYNKFKEMINQIEDYADAKDKEYDIAAKAIRESIDLDELLRIMKMQK